MAFWRSALVEGPATTSSADTAPRALLGIWLLAGQVLLWMWLPTEWTSTHLSARMAVYAYGVAVLSLLGKERTKVLRLLWTAAWGVYVLHVVVAFGEAHHWSHAEAMRHVEQQSGFGPGLFFSHLFTLLWLADLLWWWLRPATHALRPAWIVWLLHGYLAFIVFNATVIYATGAVRLMGLLLFAFLSAGLLPRRRSVTASQ